MCGTVLIHCFMTELPHKYNTNSCNVLCSWIAWQAAALCNLKWGDGGKAKKGAVPLWQWGDCCGSEVIVAAVSTSHTPACTAWLTWFGHRQWSGFGKHPRNVLILLQNTAHSPFQGFLQKYCHLSPLCLSLFSPVSSLAPRTSWWWHWIQYKLGWLHQTSVTIAALRQQQHKHLVSFNSVENNP